MGAPSRFLKLLGTITLINILSRVFAFLRELFIGYQYGTTYQADSIITAFTIPNFFHIVLGGAVTTAFISVYGKQQSQVKHDFARTVFTMLALVVGTLTIAFMLLPSFWMELFFGGMSGDALALTEKLFRLTAPATFFLVVGIALSGLHNVYGHYRLSTTSTFLFNALYLIIGAGLTPWLSAYSYSLGAALGAAAMFGFLVYFIRKRNLMPLKPKLVRMPQNKRFLKLALPLMLGGATMQFYQLIQRMFAAPLDNGAIAALNYASKMTQMPQAVLMTSVTTMIYPMLTKAAGEGDQTKITNAYQKGFRLLTLLLLPASAFLVIYAKDIMTFILQYGAFSTDSTSATYPLLQIYAIAVLGLALNTYITRFFYAAEKTVLPVALNVLSVIGINILVIILFREQLGAEAIALGTAISAIINMLLLIICARWQLKLNVSSHRFIGKIILYTAAATAALWLVSLLPFTLALLSLATGGITLLLIIGTGIKLVH
ncbi:murein biosynthesis integral membrane protein MurJ [Barrientosiimonas marina]|uniref:Murein biosynthesis integral membrane protein MurJ n=1 Tax=Lentibacillus kimchii TaxID=1542911 RepID=A0ABW2UTJ2_9BACI